MSEVETAFQVAERELEAATKRVDELTISHAAASESRRTVGLSVVRAEKTLLEFETVQKELPRYSSVCAKLESTAEKLSATESGYRDIVVWEKECAARVATLRAAVHEAEASASKAKAAAEQQQTLLIGLRSLITQRDCPLCGAEYESIEALLLAADRAMGLIPPDTQSLIENVQRLRSSLSESMRETKVVRNAKNESQNSIVSLGKLIVSLNAEKFRIEEKSSALGIELEENHVGSRVDAAREKLRELNVAEKSAVNRLETVNDELRSQEIQAKKARDRLGVIKADRDRIRAKIEAVALRLAELGHKKDEVSPDADVQKDIEKIKGELTKVEKARSIAEADKRDAEIQEQESTRRQEEINGRLSALEREGGTLKGSIQTFTTQCDDFGIAPTPENFIEARQIIESSLKAVFAARRMGESIEVIGSLDALKADREAAKKELENAIQRAATLRKRVESLEGAKFRAESWMLPLTESLETMVGKTLRLHQLEIERHFKAMIPSPHLFDQIVMRHTEERLEIGVRYRHQSDDAGEPYFFLSNAQLNVLALAIFLSLGAKQRWSNLDSLLLDDPVQHLDDLDAVAFLDTIRAIALGRFGTRKQIILSTCDKNLYGLMIRKFESLKPAGLSFNAISLSERGTAGPVIHYDVQGNSANSSIAS